MKRALVLLFTVASLVAGAKTFPDPVFDVNMSAPWIPTPDVIVDIKWVRSYSPVSEVRDGACWMYYRDDNEQTMLIADPQLDQCVNSGKPLISDNPPEGSRRIHLYKVDSRAEVARRLTQVIGPNDQVDQNPAAFALEVPGNVCMIVAYYARAYTFGHELKHCYDGSFHTYDHKAWKVR
jgi:hypothetical protein